MKLIALTQPPGGSKKFMEETSYGSKVEFQKDLRANGYIVYKIYTQKEYEDIGSEKQVSRKESQESLKKIKKKLKNRYGRDTQMEARDTIRRAARDAGPRYYIQNREGKYLTSLSGTEYKFTNNINMAYTYKDKTEAENTIKTAKLEGSKVVTDSQDECNYRETEDLNAGEMEKLMRVVMTNEKKIKELENQEQTPETKTKIAALKKQNENYKNGKMTDARREAISPRRNFNTESEAKRYSNEVSKKGFNVQIKKAKGTANEEYYQVTVEPKPGYNHKRVGQSWEVKIGDARSVIRDAAARITQDGPMQNPQGKEFMIKYETEAGPDMTYMSARNREEAIKFAKERARSKGEKKFKLISIM